ncbi:MAG: hypothetical protein J7L73_05385 [Anaerolineales bacterium]|nr:hypothetical protein [Anaerolineales bacterium]
MRISAIVREVIDVAKKYNLQPIERDRTDNIVSLQLLIDNDLFIQIYGNKLKNKLNLALVFKNRRLYGFDSEGGIYHCHPLDDPDTHDFVDEKKSIHDFVMESMEFLEQKELL